MARNLNTGGKIWQGGGDSGLRLGRLVELLEGIGGRGPFVCFELSERARRVVRVRFSGLLAGGADRWRVERFAHCPLGEAGELPAVDELAATVESMAREAAAASREGGRP